MAHDHHHHQDDTYFLDQLCMVGLSGAFGVICLCLFFIQRTMLTLLLGPQFHLFVAMSGFTLLGLAIVRAITLWREAQPSSALASLPIVAPPPHDHHHHHHHHHHHDHDHHHEGHDHDHPHDHSHGHHDHSHADHDHSDHDHGWAPWRYVVLIVPILLFMLGLPNKGPAVPDSNDEESRVAEAARESSQATSWIGLDEWSRLVRLGKIAGDNAMGDAMPVEFKRLHDSPNDRDDKAILQDKVVKVRGQFSPNASDPRFFSLIRFKIGCCAGDAVSIPINVVAREPVTQIKRGEWAEVVGKVEYGNRGGTPIVRLTTVGPTTVTPCSQDPHPYVP